MYVEFICKFSLLDVKLQQLKKFLKDRKKRLKREYLNKLIEKQIDQNPIAKL